MKKSVYSVVLDDEVIAEIDRLAYQNNTSRSGMINRILAGYVSMETPEERISDIFSEVASLLYGSKVFKESSPPTASMMNLRSCLSYKYNPTVKYSVELYRNLKNGSAGVIRVSVRSTNSALLLEMIRFFKLFTQIEMKYGYEGTSSFEDSVFKRPIYPRENPFYMGGQGKKSDGQILASYISLFDRSLNLYFNGENEEIPNQIEALYRNYLYENKEII